MQQNPSISTAIEPAPIKPKVAWPLLLALALGAFAYIVHAPMLGMTSDDYVTIFGTELTPIPAVHESLALGSYGKITPVRLLSQPFNGYVPLWIGLPAAHVLQVMLHLLTGLTLYFLLRRLGWTTVNSGWASAFMLVTPGAIQAVTWWTANLAISVSLIMLLAAHAYLSWSRNPRRIGMLLLCCALCFFQLLFYELWLAGFIVFWAIELYIQPAGSSLFKTLIRSTKRASITILPFILWVILAKLTYTADHREAHVTLFRVPVVFISTQVRCLQSMLLQPWQNASIEGLKTLTSPAGMILGVISLLLLILSLRSEKYTESKGDDRKFPLGRALMLAWLILLASRMVFILQNGVAMHTRHNYGATVGVAIGLAACLAFTLNQLKSLPAAQWVVRGVAGIVVIIFTLTSAGISSTFANTTRDEEGVYQALLPVAKNMDGRQVILIKEPTAKVYLDHTFYDEFDGVWLEERLQFHNPKVFAYVVPDIQRDAATITFRSRKHLGWLPPNAKISRHNTLPPALAIKPLDGDFEQLTFDNDQILLYERVDGKFVRVEK
ncbi:MAG: hypothetical protein H7144_01880 [Burkholderiales bacterium]|nr:hypothetical protein [Phycisphaerae bacterium]